MDTLFRDPDMSTIFSAEATIRHLLAFEAALARAEARAGVIPNEAAKVIDDVCKNATFDAGEIFREAQTSGTPVIPLIRFIAELAGEEFADYIHVGATSQDTIDTALMLQMREGVDLLVEQLCGVGARCAELAQSHRGTLMPGRTLLQHAVPVTFGLKAARWLASAVRHAQRLIALRSDALAIQFGGAAGTLAVLGAKGTEVSRFLAEELDLPEPILPWHAERERIAEVATQLGIVAGSMAKVATDLTLLQQTEVAEVSDQGKGASSAMPQKRNPVDPMFATAAAKLAIGDVSVILYAMAHPHERAAGEWQAEWGALPRLFCHTATAVRHVGIALENLVVDASKMRSNLDDARGVIMAESLATALSEKIGRQEALKVVSELTEIARTNGIGLRAAYESDSRTRELLAPADVIRAFDPAAYLGSTATFIDRALAGFDELKQVLEERD